MALLAGIVSAPSLTNGFAYDDLPIVRDNPRVHSLASLWTYLSESYWHWSHCCAAYRPLSLWLFSLEWLAGHGSPAVFHAVNVALFVVLAVGVYLLSREIIGDRAAWLTAALFAVHPVHVEAVANVVGQEEVLLACLTVAAVYSYLRARSQESLSTATRLGLAALVVMAPLVKEQGFVLPLILLSAELTVVTDSTPWSRRLRSLAPTYTLMLLGLALVAAVRTSVLGGLGAGPIAPYLESLTFGGRLLTALRTVPSWARLLSWPGHLQANYTPPAYSPATAIGLREAAGLMLLLVIVAAGLVSLRRRPAIGFGLLWCLLALAPVSNVAFPTTLIIAERTLFLPSIGVALVAGSFADALWPTLESLPRLVQSGIVAAVTLTLLAGGLRTAGRQHVWKDNDVLFAQTVRDAHDSYGAPWLYANWLAERGATAKALSQYREAVTLYQDDPKLYEDYGQLLRRTGSCRPAIDQFARAVALDPDRTTARSRLFECHMAVGDYAHARDLVAAEVAAGRNEFGAMLARASQAIAVNGSPSAGPGFSR